MIAIVHRTRFVIVTTLLLSLAESTHANDPVPPPADIKVAVETLRDVYETDYLAAEIDTRGKKGLALKLFEGAPKRKTPAMIFACYNEARQFAAAAGEADLALAALAALQKRFHALPVSLSTETVQALAQGPLSPTQAEQVSKLAFQWAQQALEREEYSTAANLGKTVLVLAKKALDPDLSAEARAFVTRSEALASAVETLKTKPDDAPANDRLADYWLVTRGRWDSALKYLVKGSDPALIQAATQDLLRPRMAKERTAVGELWHKLAKATTGERKRLYLERAWEWYAAAVTVAKDDDDLKPSERALEIERANPDLFERILHGHTAAVAAITVSRDGKTLLSVGNDNSVRVWDSATGKLLRTLEGHTDWVGSVVLGPDARTAYTAGGDNTIRVWDLASGQVLKLLEGHTVAVRGLALSTDGKLLLSGSSDRSIRLWDTATSKEIRKYGDESESIECVALSHDGNRVFAGSAVGIITVYDRKSGDVVTKFDKHGDSLVYTLTVSRDGKTAISGARDKTIRVWEVETGKLLRTLNGHTEQVYQVMLSPDEKHLLSASYDKSVRIWDFGSGKELKKYEGHRDGVQGACYAPDGRSIYSASWDKTLRRWRVPAVLGSGAPQKKID